MCLSESRLGQELRNVVCFIAGLVLRPVGPGPEVLGSKWGFGAGGCVCVCLGRIREES